MLKKLTVSVMLLVLMLSSLPTGLFNFTLTADASSNVVLGSSTTQLQGGLGKLGGSAGGIKTDKIGYRFCITQDKLKAGITFTPNTETVATLTEKAIRHYDNHLPQCGANFTIMPSSHYSASAKRATYIPGGGYLVLSEMSANDGNFGPIISQGAQSSGLMNQLNNIYTKIKNHPQGIKGLTTQDFKDWYAANTSAIGGKQKYIEYFSWIVGDGNGIEARLKSQLVRTAGGATGEQYILDQAAYIMYMIMMYGAIDATNTNPAHKDKIINSFNNYSQVTDSWKSHPGFFAIEPVIVVVPPQGMRLYVSASDYIQYSHGSTEANRINRAEWTSNSYASSYDMMVDNLRTAHMANPYREAPLNKSGSIMATLENPFGYGYSMISGLSMATIYGNANTTTPRIESGARHTNTLFNRLHFNGNLYGFMLALNSQVVPKVIDKPAARQDIYHKEKKRNVIVVPKDQTSVDLKYTVPLYVEMQAKSGTQVALNKILQDAKEAQGFPKAQLWVNIVKSVNGVEEATIPNKVGNDPNPLQTLEAYKRYSGDAHMIERNRIENLTKGWDSFKLQHNIKETVSYTSDKPLTIRFDYKSGLVIKLDNDPKNDINVAKDDGLDYIEFVLQRDAACVPSATDLCCEDDPSKCPPPQVQPEELILDLFENGYFYGEVKEGEAPQNEKWEAMAGVPSTKSLHYSIGGTEYLLRAQFKYEPNLTKTRSVSINSEPIDFWGNFGGEGIISIDNPDAGNPRCSSNLEQHGILGERNVSVPSTCESVTAIYEGDEYCVRRETPPPVDPNANPPQTPIAPESMPCLQTARELSHYNHHGLDIPAPSVSVSYAYNFTYAVVKLEKLDVFQPHGGSIEGLQPLIEFDGEQLDKYTFYSDTGVNSYTHSGLHYMKTSEGDKTRFYVKDNPGAKIVKGDYQIPVTDGVKPKYDGYNGANCGNIKYWEQMSISCTFERDANIYSADPYAPQMKKEIDADQGKLQFDFTIVGDSLILNGSEGTIPLYVAEQHKRVKRYNGPPENLTKSSAELTANTISGGSPDGNGALTGKSFIGAGEGSITERDLALIGYNGQYHKSNPSYDKYLPQTNPDNQNKAEPVNFVTTNTFGFSIGGFSHYGKAHSDFQGFFKGQMTNNPKPKQDIHTPELPIRNTHENGEYTFRNPKIIYERIKEVQIGDPLLPWGDLQEFDPKYSDDHDTINKVLIHTPVSSEYSEVVPVDRKWINIADGSRVQTLHEQREIGSTANLGASNTLQQAYTALDRKFEIRFPDRGTYNVVNQFGIPETTTNIGPSYVSPESLGQENICTGAGYCGDDNGPFLITTEWTKAKYVKFDIPVIYNNTMYLPGQEIQVPVMNCPLGNCFYEFYLPLAAGEHNSTQVQFISEAINSPYREESVPVNSPRNGSNLRADHSTLKINTMSVVGRAGNVVLEDSTDFRYSNLFKTPLTNGKWLIPNLVKDVDEKTQNTFFVTDKNYNLESINENSNKTNATYVNTYNTLDGLTGKREILPLTPHKNNIEQFRKMPTRLGNKVMGSFQSIGDYHNGMAQVKYYYYAYDVVSQTIQAVDLYLNEAGQYKQFYKFGAYDTGANFDYTKMADSTVFLNWKTEADRRNYKTKEREITERISSLYTKEFDANGDGIFEPLNSSGVNEIDYPLAIPHGWNYAFGNSQIQQLYGRNRTFHGSITNDTSWGSGTQANKNPGGKIGQEEYEARAQRWHFSVYLPATTVPVPTGQAFNKTNIDKVRNGNTIILAAADIRIIGENYIQKVNHGPDTMSIDFTGTPRVIRNSQLPSPGGTVNPSELVLLTFFSSNKSIRDDLNVSGTH